MPSRHFRAHQRYALSEPVSINAVHRQTLSEGVSLDLGLGGLSCQLDTPLRLGEEVEASFKNRPIRSLRGIVAWIGWSDSSAVRLGIRFVDPDDDSLCRTLDLLKLVGPEVQN